MKPDTSSTLSYSTRGTPVATLCLFGIVFATAGGALLIVRLNPGLPLRILAVAVPVVCGVAFVFQFLRELARMDELQLRVRLEGAATASLGVFIFTLLYPIFQMAGFVGPLQPYYVSCLLAGFFVFGYVKANLRYL